METALRLLTALPRKPGRFLLAPALAGGSWLVGHGTPLALEPGAGLEALPHLLEPGPKGTVVLLGYELGRSLLRRPGRAREDRGLPRAVAIRVEEAVAIDPATGRIEGDAALAGLRGPLPTHPAQRCSVEVSLDRRAHAAAVGRVHELIRAGETYQTNLTVRFSAPWSTGPEALLPALLTTGPQACTAYLDLPGGASVVSASPELLLRYDAATRLASSEPIKGTRPRGEGAEADEALAAALAADPKERAEHVMIVDLVRNDLGRVAEVGSVHVPALFRVDRLPTVHHLVSEIAARLAPARTLPELVASLFPAGSITGAPKLRTMEIIDELEPVARGPYCGSIGLVRPDGSCALSVAIRTAVLQDGRVDYGAGGGITIDAAATREWDELVLKARPFLSAVGAAAPC
ncbi:anthranilate synthase component I family protein [Vulgatibacter sp.]|uniref:anthranilate synthase component I family protein n=1 Tax=Vulgatibacter sp. TaxID=1971226 RepID=UPI00356311DD